MLLEQITVSLRRYPAHTTRLGRSVLCWNRKATSKEKTRWRIKTYRKGALRSPVRTALSQVLWSEEAGRLEQALESLSEAHREVILLRKLEELGFREIGERLGKSEDASRMLFGRAMTALTLALSEEGA